MSRQDLMLSVKFYWNVNSLRYPLCWQKAKQDL